MSASKLVRAEAERLFGPEVGCLDGSCLYGHPGGMQTNGGCQCLKEVRDGGRAAVVHASRLGKLARALAVQLDASAEGAKGE